MRCTKCGADNRGGRKFCAQCGAVMSAKCARCGASNEPGEKFCGDCGAALNGNATAAPARSSDSTSVAPVVRVLEQLDPPALLDGERKTITVLFADIKGSMGQIEDLDPEAARAIVDPALAIMAEAVNRYQGHVAQSTGDGVFALFGAPIAHEDHPQRAIYAAMRMQEELRRYSDRLRAEGKAPVEIRIGINTGEVVMRSVGKDQSHAEYLPAGHAVGLASRLQTIAPTGSIALSEHTRRLVEGYFQLKSLGPTRMKGVSEPVNVYEVLGLGPLRTRLQRSASRGLSRFVGRDAEIAQMKRALDQAKSGHGQVVAAMAEPGVGKSRLFFEFKAVAQSGCMVLEAFSISHGKASAYLPVIDLLHGYFKISAGDDRRTRREKVTGRVLALDRSLEDTLPYLFGLLGIVEEADPLAGMDAQVRRRRTLDAIKRILLRESLNQPLIVIFEDLHWIDGETQALLNLLADSIGTAKILLLINYRPEYHHEWGSKTYYTQLRLDALGKESADKMLGAMLGDGVELALLKGLIIEKTEGNPFFMEETVEMLLDDGALVRNGSIKLVKPLAELKIPPTVQAILASRIDRLPPAEKDLLQTLAVIGREFGLGLVQRVVTESEDELNRMLHDLQFAEFIYEQPAAGDVEYTFKHALTQQVAYQSVLMERRKTLHERAAVGVETLHAGQLDDHLAELAYHYERSANLARAIDYLWRAANQASQRSLYSDAIGYVNRGLELLAATPESDARVRDELKLQMASGVALMAAKGFSSGDVERTFSRACELARTLNDPLQQFQRFGALQGLWGFHYTRHDTGAALKVAEESMTLAQNLKDDGLLKFAHYALGASLLQPGELNAARDHLERALALKDPPRFKGGIVRFGPDSNVLCLTSLSDALFSLGYPDQALQRSYEALGVVKREADPFSYGMALLFVTQAHCARREAEKGEEWCRTLIRLCNDHGFPFLLASANRCLSWATVLQGRFEEGVAMINEQRRANSGADAESNLYYVLPILAETYGRLGKFDQAFDALELWLSVRQKHSSSSVDKFYYRIRGELLLRAGDLEEADKNLRKAIRLGAKESAKTEELRSVTALARLLAAQGKRDEAHTMLADIYGWFTEGFDTADLKDAKALLDELGE